MRTVASSFKRLYIDRGALLHNLRTLRASLPSQARAAAVVKADAYGHGALYLAPALKAAGVEALAVASASEGALLRQQGITGPIWLLLGAHPQEAPALLADDLWPVSSDPELFAALSAASQGKSAGCLLKVDTGMNRLGVSPQETPQLLELVSKLPGLAPLGLVSHLSHGGDSPHSQRQVVVFNRLLAASRAAGYALENSSLLNSGGVLRPPLQAFAEAAWVRLGVALYGDNLDSGAPLRPVMRLHSRLLSVHPGKAGSGVSYGGLHVLERDTQLGVVPIGYADGYLRSLSGRAMMLVNGRLAPVLGRVCMNMTIIDLGHISPTPKIGDEVVLVGSQGQEQIGIDLLARQAGTISYELMCSLGAGLRHYYREETPD
jgi:alanine racemase